VRERMGENTPQSRVRQRGAPLNVAYEDSCPSRSDF
jgi:hypothetical protein